MNQLDFVEVKPAFDLLTVDIQVTCFYVVSPRLLPSAYHTQQLTCCKLVCSMKVSCHAFMEGTYSCRVCKVPPRPVINCCVLHLQPEDVT